MVNRDRREELQKLIFGRFLAQRLRIANEKVVINDLVEDLADGCLLVKITSALSGATFEGKALKPQSLRINKIDNANRALEFVKKLGVSTKTSAEDLVDMRANFVLGLVFTIILKFLKLDEDDEDSTDVKEALLLWCKNKTRGYENVDVKDMTIKTFGSGMVFAALIHKMRPKLIDYASFNPTDKLKNLDTCFGIAEKYFNVERYLKPEDVAQLDELGLTVFLYDWYFGVSLLQKQDVAARRIGKLADMTKLHDEMKAEYNENASNLVQWITDKKAWLAGQEIDNTMAGIRAKLSAFYSYKTEEKPAKIVVEMDLQALFDNLALRLVNNNRPPFQPSITLADLERGFADLAAKEGDASIFLHKELERQIMLEKLGNRYEVEASAVDSTLQESDQALAPRPTVDNLEDAQTNRETFEFYEKEHQASVTLRLASLTKHEGIFTAEKYEFNSAISQRRAGLDQAAATNKTNIESKRSFLEAAVAEQLAINDRVCKEFADLVAEWDKFMGPKKQAIANTDKDLTVQLADVEAQLGATDAETKLQALAAADEQFKARRLAVNPYTQQTLLDCKATWEQFKVQCSKRIDLLKEAIAEAKRSGVTTEQIEEIETNFNYFDSDKSGFLDRRELKSCLQSIGEEVNKQDLTNIITEYNVSKTGKINKEEFRAYYITKLGDTNTKEEILLGFKLLSLEQPRLKGDNLEAVVNDLSFRVHHVEYLKAEMKEDADGYDFATWTDEVFAR